MSFISDIFTGGGSDTGSSENFTREGVSEILRLLGQTREDLSPFIGAGQNAISGLQQLQTPGSLDETLGQIFGSENFQNLAGERTRAAQNQLAAGGLTRSGTALQEIANVPTQLGFDLENLLFSRNTSNLNTLFGGGLGAAQSLGGFTTTAGGQVGGLFGGQAGIENQAQIAAQQRQADFWNEIIGGGAKIGAAAASPAPIVPSDPRLKDNAEKIGELGPLNLYQWDWAEQVKGTIIEKFPTIGFMADQVKKIYPQFVSELHGFMMVNYSALLDELETNYG